jgi:DNA repair protein RadC
VDVGRETLVRYGGLRGLLAAERPGKEAVVKGLGPAKSAALIAAREICRRRLEQELPGKNVLRDPQSVLDYLAVEMRDRSREAFKVLFLDAANAVIFQATLFEGTVDQTAVHPREIMREAIRCQASALVLVHNHPSGRTEPSPEDVELTRKLESACRFLSIRVLDHLIVGGAGFFSFREHGLLC